MNTADERLEKLKTDMEYLGVSQAAAASAVGVSAKTIGNYLSGVTSGGETLRKIEKFLREREFYLGYCFQQKDDFSRLFTDIWNELKEYHNANELCAKLNLTLSEANHIKENRKALDVRGQYSILTGFHELCKDNTGTYYPRLAQTGEALCRLLGLEFPDSVTKSFASLLNELSEKLDFEISDETLAEKAGIPLEDLEDLRQSDDCAYDAWKKCDILDALRRICRKSSSKAAQRAYRKLNWLLVYYDGNNKPPADVKAYFDWLLDRKIADFKKYPIEIQNIILEHSSVFFDFYYASEAVNFHDYIQRCPIPVQLGLGEDYTVNEFDYLKSIMDLFRKLPEDRKNTVSAMFTENFTLSFPDWQSNKGLSEFEITVQCLELALITKKRGPLSEISGQKIPPLSKAPLYLNQPQIQDWLWDYYNSSKVAYQLEFNSMEWCLWAALNAAVHSRTDLNPLLSSAFPI